jgi:hypothetical protein
MQEEFRATREDAVQGNAGEGSPERRGGRRLERRRAFPVPDCVGKTRRKGVSSGLWELYDQAQSLALNRRYDVAVVRYCPSVSVSRQAEPLGPPRLSLKRVSAWADAHRARAGRWPASHDGAVQEAPKETWCTIVLDRHRRKPRRDCK